MGGDAEAEAEGEVAGKSAEDGPKKPTVTRNQFNYSERAAQTINLPLRVCQWASSYLDVSIMPSTSNLQERSTNTEPPPHKTYSGSVTQWSIFDAYLEDQQLKEKSAKEKSKTAKKEESTTGLGGAAFASQNSLVVSTGESQPPHEEYKHTADVKKVASILERMCNQNTFDEVTHDFKYWNDAADEFRGMAEWKWCD